MNDYCFIQDSAHSVHVASKNSQESKPRKVMLYTLAIVRGSFKQTSNFIQYFIVIPIWISLKPVYNYTACAGKEHNYTLTIFTTSLGPRTFESNSTWPLLVDNATTAFFTPIWLMSVRSIICTHDEQVMPSIWIVYKWHNRQYRKYHKQIAPFNTNNWGITNFRNAQRFYHKKLYRASPHPLDL